MLRSVGSVLAGAAVWAVLWLTTMAAMSAAFPGIIQEGEPLHHVPMLWTYILVSVVFSIGAGYVTGMVAARREVQHALALGALQLALGVFAEVSYWELLPVWYHLTFLILLVPGNVAGGWLRAQRGVGSGEWGKREP